MVYHTAEAWDRLYQFRVKVLGKPEIRKWRHSPTHEAWKPFCPPAYFSPCIENFLGFHSQVWSITLLLQSESFSLRCKITKFFLKTQKKRKKSSKKVWVYLKHQPISASETYTISPVPVSRPRRNSTPVSDRDRRGERKA